MPADVKSKAQAGYYGAIIAGAARGEGGPSVAQARRALRGAKVSKLPARSGKKKKKRKKGQSSARNPYASRD